MVLTQLVKELDRSAFEQARREEGQPGYHPALRVAKVGVEMALAATAYDLAQLGNRRRVAASG